MTQTDTDVGELKVLDHTGDTQISWNRGNSDEIAAARTHFNAMKAKGYLAYRLEDGERGEVIREFDPAAGTIVMAPQMQGG